jgi:predicted PurR-regulated permease PerM
MVFNIIARLKGIYQRNKLQAIEALLLIGSLSALWRIDNSFVSFICGVSAGVLFYRLAERISKHGISKA